MTHCEIEATLGISSTRVYKILHEHLVVKKTVGVRSCIKKGLNHRLMKEINEKKKKKYVASKNIYKTVTGDVF